MRNAEGFRASRKSSGIHVPHSQTTIANASIELFCKWAKVSLAVTLSDYFLNFTCYLFSMRLDYGGLQFLDVFE